MAPVPSTHYDRSPPYLTSFPTQIHLDDAQAKALREVEWAHDISTAQLKAIVKQFQHEFTRGLTETHTLETQDVFLPMIPTFVHDVPNGTEKGVFLALDLGGTNLRVCEVTLNGDHTFALRSQKYRVSEQLKIGPAVDLFDYIAQSVDDFLSELGTLTSPEEGLHLGFTFSFPVNQSALDRGTLISWTKGFSASGAIGQDVVKMLQDALDKKHIHVRVSALVNDTVGTLMARGYAAGDSLTGAIFGTGTNGAYVENLAAIKKIANSTGPETQFPKMIINTEWGAFDNERVVLPVTIWDNKLDRESINVRKHQFEKQISGMYLGEVARNILLHLIDQSVLFEGYSTPMLNTHYGLDTALLSAVEAHAPGPSHSSSAGDVEARLALTRVILEKDVGVPKSKLRDADCALVQRVCEVVGTRAARLSATAIAAVARQTGYADPNNKLPIRVGVDGSVCEHYPHFETRLRAALIEVSGEQVERRVEVALAKDGSGIGAALCALQAKKQQQALSTKQQ